MASPLRVAVTLIGLLLLAGCMGASKAPAPQTESQVTVGTVLGQVLDEEQRPLENVAVLLQEAGLNTTTTRDGNFRLDGVLIGRHTLLVEAPGFKPARQLVDVTEEEPARVTLVLVAVAVVTPYVEVLPFEGYIQYGNEYLDVVTGMLQLSGCVKCSFRFNASGDVEALVSEIRFVRTVDNPHGPELLAYDLFNQDQSQRFTPKGQYWGPGGKFQINRVWGEEGQRFLHVHACDDLWFCLDQTFTNYVSLFHHAMPPERYTALPP